MKSPAAASKPKTKPAGRPKTAAAGKTKRRASRTTVDGTIVTGELQQSRAYKRRQALLAVSGIVRRQRTPAAKTAAPKAGKGRKGQRAMTIFLHPLAKTLFDEIALEHGKTVQELGLEAVNLLLEAYDRKPVA